jgi:hypothetical protein
MQRFSSVFSYASAKTLFLILFLGLASACEFIDKTSSSIVQSDDLGANVSLPDTFPTDASGNSHRMVSAQRVQQVCDNGSCSQLVFSYIDYSYIGDFLTTATEIEIGAITNTVTSERQYYYNGDQLDKIAVRATDNFHTLHDYYYDNENDYDNNAKETLNKLRREYICDIDLADASTDSCARLKTSPTEHTAIQVVNYIYNEDGYLYRKEFDVDNDDKIDHQKIYYYENNILSRVDSDNFYNGRIDERYSYQVNDELSLLTYLDKSYLSTLTRGTDVAVSYKQGNQETYIYNESESNRSFTYSFKVEANSDVQVSLNDTVLIETTDYTVSNTTAAPYGGSITIDGTISLGNEDEIVISTINSLDPDNKMKSVVTKECYFNQETSEDCTSTSSQSYHWIFTWEEQACWAGGLDDIDPETRAIDYLCKQNES